MEVRAGTRRPAPPLLNLLDRRKQKNSLVHLPHELLLRGQPCGVLCRHRADKTGSLPTRVCNLESGPVNRGQPPGRDAAISAQHRCRSKCPSVYGGGREVASLLRTGGTSLLGGLELALGKGCVTALDKFRGRF